MRRQGVDPVESSTTGGGLSEAVRVPPQASPTHVSRLRRPAFDLSWLTSCDHRSPYWVPKLLRARAQVKTLRPDPFGEEGRDENGAERWQEGERAPPRTRAGNGQPAAGAGGEVTDGGGGGRVRNWSASLPPSKLGLSLLIGCSYAGRAVLPVSTPPAQSSSGKGWC